MLADEIIVLKARPAQKRLVGRRDPARGIKFENAVRAIERHQRAAVSERLAGF